LTRWSRRAKTAPALAVRSKIVLACAEGLSNKQVAAQLRVTPGSDSLACPVRGAPTRRVGQRAAAGRPPSILPDQVEDVLVATQEQTRRTRHTGRGPSTAARSGLSPSTIGRISRQFELKPHVQDFFKLSADPQFVDKVVDVVGLYHHPPERAAVLCVAEKSGMRSVVSALHAAPGRGVPPVPDRDQQGRPRRSGRAPDLRQPRHPHTPAIRDWLARHARFHLHFTPTGSSWINQAERWFGLLTEQLIRRGVHKSVLALENDVQQMDTNWNQNPKPFVWTNRRGHPPITIEYIAKISDAGH
jgi:hypothetical protein